MRLLVLLVLAMVASPTPALTPMPLVGTTWGWHPAPGDGDAVAPERYTLALRPDGSLAVQADCNRGRGRYTQEDDRLVITDLAVTKKGCPRPTRGETFVRRLGSVERFRFEGIDLVLLPASGTGELRMRPLSR